MKTEKTDTFETDLNRALASESSTDTFDNSLNEKLFAEIEEKEVLMPKKTVILVIAAAYILLAAGFTLIIGTVISNPLILQALLFTELGILAGTIIIAATVLYSINHWEGVVI